MVTLKEFNAAIESDITLISKYVSLLVDCHIALGTCEECVELVKAVHTRIVSHLEKYKSAPISKDVILAYVEVVEASCRLRVARDHPDFYDVQEDLEYVELNLNILISKVSFSLGEISSTYLELLKFAYATLSSLLTAVRVSKHISMPLKDFSSWYFSYRLRVLEFLTKAEHILVRRISLIPIDEKFLLGTSNTVQRISNRPEEILSEISLLLARDHLQLAKMTDELKYVSLKKEDLAKLSVVERYLVTSTPSTRLTRSDLLLPKTLSSLEKTLKIVDKRGILDATVLESCALLQALLGTELGHYLWSSEVTELESPVLQSNCSELQHRLSKCVEESLQSKQHSNLLLASDILSTSYGKRDSYQCALWLLLYQSLAVRSHLTQLGKSASLSYSINYSNVLEVAKETSLCLSIIPNKSTFILSAQFNEDFSQLYLVFGKAASTSSSDWYVEKVNFSETQRRNLIALKERHSNWIQSTLKFVATHSNTLKVEDDLAVESLASIPNEDSFESPRYMDLYSVVDVERELQTTTRMLNHLLQHEMGRSSKVFEYVSSLGIKDLGNVLVFLADYSLHSLPIESLEIVTKLFPNSSVCRDYSIHTLANRYQLNLSMSPSLPASYFKVKKIRKYFFIESFLI